MPNGPPLVEDFFTTFFVEQIIDPETTVTAPFTNGLDFIQVTLLEPLPQNPKGVVLCLVAGTPPQLAQLIATPGALLVGEGQARVILGIKQPTAGWGTADFPSKWKRGP